jgi:Icc protein
MDIKILQLSDSHLHGEPGARLIGVDTDASLRAVVDLAGNEKDVTAILATGDLSQDGSLKSYQRFAEITRCLDAPIHWIPGNHDAVDYFHKPDSAFPLRPRSTLGLGDWRVILLDSVVPGKDSGNLDEDEFEYLRNQLDGGKYDHCLVVLHHQPVATGAEWLDTMQLCNHEAFRDCLEQSKRVRAVIYGHIHQDFNRTIDGIRFMSAPSTCFQFKPGSDRFALDDRLPGYRCLVLKDSGDIETSVRRIKDFDMELDEAAKGY